MKLAEALQERADLNRRIEQLSSRLNSNVLVQEGEETLRFPRICGVNWTLPSNDLSI